MTRRGWWPRGEGLVGGFGSQGGSGAALAAAILLAARAAALARSGAALPGPRPRTADRGTDGRRWRRWRSAERLRTDAAVRLDLSRHAARARRRHVARAGAGAASARGAATSGRTSSSRPGGASLPPRSRPWAPWRIGMPARAWSWRRRSRQGAAAAGGAPTDASSAAAARRRRRARCGPLRPIGRGPQRRARLRPSGCGRREPAARWRAALRACIAGAGRVAADRLRPAPGRVRRRRRSQARHRPGPAPRPAVAARAAAAGSRPRSPGASPAGAAAPVAGGGRCCRSPGQPEREPPRPRADHRHGVGPGRERAGSGPGGVRRALPRARAAIDHRSGRRISCRTGRVDAA